MRTRTILEICAGLTMIALLVALSVVAYKWLQPSGRSAIHPGTHALFHALFMVMEDPVDRAVDVELVLEFSADDGSTLLLISAFGARPMEHNSILFEHESLFISHMYGRISVWRIRIIADGVALFDEENTESHSWHARRDLFHDIARHDDWVVELGGRTWTPTPGTKDAVGEYARRVSFPPDPG